MLRTLFLGLTAILLSLPADAADIGTGIAVVPTPLGQYAIAPIVSASAENSHVLKAAAGNVYAVYAANHTATAGFLLLFNSLTAPGDGAVTPAGCAALPASGSASISYGSGPPGYYSTGIVAVLSSGANCFTKTTGTITGFIGGSVQ